MTAQKLPTGLSTLPHQSLPVLTQRQEKAPLTGLERWSPLPVLALNLHPDPAAHPIAPRPVALRHHPAPLPEAQEVQPSAPVVLQYQESPFP